jgi:hypothetical protein
MAYMGKALDLKNRDQYARHWNGLPRKLKAWEFLRRSSEYCHLWEAESARVKLSNGSYEVDWWQTGYEQTPNGGMILSADDPNLALSITKEIQDRWRITSLIPPWQDKPKQLFFIEKIEHTLKCEFDLTMPIKPQLEKFETIAKNYQKFWKAHGEKLPKKKPKWRFTKDHPEYLRLLDAAATGLRNKQLALIFYPQEDDLDGSTSKRISDRLKQARQISNHDYINFALPHNW